MNQNWPWPAIPFYFISHAIDIDILYAAQSSTVLHTLYQNRLDYDQQPVLPNFL